MGFPWWLSLNCRRPCFDPWLRKVPWRRKWQPIWYSCLENLMDRAAWMAVVHGVTELNATVWLIHTHTHTHIHKYTHIHIHINTHTYTYIHTYTYTHIHIYTHTHIHKYTHTHIHIYINTHTYTYTHTHTHTLINTLEKQNYNHEMKSEYYTKGILKEYLGKRS